MKKILLILFLIITIFIVGCSQNEKVENQEEILEENLLDETNQSNQLNSEVIPESIIYAKLISWNGPDCDQPEVVCFESLEIYDNGKVISDGISKFEKDLSQEELDSIINKIIESGILDMSCDFSGIVGQSTGYYYINLNSIEKDIELYSTCELETDKIDSFIESIIA